MPTDLEELEAINSAAIDSIDRLEKQDSTHPPNFWETDPAKKFRPSQQNISVPLFESSRKYDDPVPRRYYRSSLSSYETSGYNQMSDSFYRRMLVSIYKSAPKAKEEPVRNEEREAVNISKSMYLALNLFSEQSDLSESSALQNIPIRRETTPPRKTVTPQRSMTTAVNRRLPAVSSHTRDQLVAIIMSGSIRILTTIVLNWARDRDVPYELL